MAGLPGKRHVLVALVLSGLAGGGAHGQQLLEGRGKIAEYYGRPNQKQMSLFLEGARVQPLTNDQLFITEPRLQTFSLQGLTNLTARAPRCIMDRRRGTISSSGPIQAELAQGKFLISGDGFLLRQTNSDLTISNHVRTVLQPEMLERASAEAGPGKGPVEILSRQFEYSTNYGLAVWRGDVRLKGEQIAMNCEVLSAKLPSGQGGVQSLGAPSAGAHRPGGEEPASQGRLERITAGQHVSVDYAGFQATGDAAVYTTETDQLELSGHPAWRAQSREGSAEELIVERTNQVLRATGHGIVKMPGQGLARVGLHLRGGPASTNAVSPPPGPASGPPPLSTLEVLSESYVLRTNLAEFSGPVRVSDRAGAEVRGTMTCARLTAGFGQTNQLERMVAEHDVVIRQEDTEFLAGRAVYEGTNGVMDLTEEPKWASGSRNGRGDFIRLSTAPEGMLVVGHALMRLPAEELASAEVVSHGVSGQPAASSAGETGAAPFDPRFSPVDREPAASSAGETAPGAAHRPATAKLGGTNSPMAEITAEEYTLTPGGAVFEQEAHIEHPQMKWSSQTITVQWPEGGSTRHILAERAVRFELIGQNDRQMEGQGAEADYAYSVTNGITNETMVLMGPPDNLAQLVMRRNPPPGALTDNPAEWVPTGSGTEQGTVTDTMITLDRIHERIRTSRGRQWAIHIETPPENRSLAPVPKLMPKKRKFDERRMGMGPP